MLSLHKPVVPLLPAPENLQAEKISEFTYRLTWSPVVGASVCNTLVVLPVYNYAVYRPRHWLHVLQ